MRTSTALAVALGLAALTACKQNPQTNAADNIEANAVHGSDSLDNAMAWAQPTFALFNGTNVFLYPEGQSLDFPATVRVVAEPAHRVVTGMMSAGGARTYRAASYHELVDMPFMVGAFDLDSAMISGRVE